VNAQPARLSLIKKLTASAIGLFSAHEKDFCLDFYSGYFPGRSAGAGQRHATTD
jgi:hypothetical protein